MTDEKVILSDLKRGFEIDEKSIKNYSILYRILRDTGGESDIIELKHRIEFLSLLIERGYRIFMIPPMEEPP